MTVATIQLVMAAFPDVGVVMAMAVARAGFHMMAVAVSMPMPVIVVMTATAISAMLMTVFAMATMVVIVAVFGFSGTGDSKKSSGSAGGDPFGRDKFHDVIGFRDSEWCLINRAPLDGLVHAFTHHGGDVNLDEKRGGFIQSRGTFFVWMREGNV